MRWHPWCGDVHVVESDTNKGLARSIIDGVTELCASDGRVIVLEDDLVVSTGFLAYMNEALARYKHNDRVMSIAGHTYDLGRNANAAVFMPGFSSWGWSTWARAWTRFEENPSDVDLLRRREIRRAFNIDDSAPKANMLEDSVAGRIDSWAIRWAWTIHRAGGLTLFPLRSLVMNVGIGPEATHTRQRDAIPAAHFSFDNHVDSFPAEISTDPEAYEAWKRAQRGSHLDRLISMAILMRRPGVPLDERVRRARDLLAILGSP